MAFGEEQARFMEDQEHSFSNEQRDAVEVHKAETLLRIDTSLLRIAFALENTRTQRVLRVLRSLKHNIMTKAKEEWAAWSD